MHNHHMSFTADGDIRICRVVEMSSAGDFMVTESDGTNMPFGISQEWVQGAPGTPFAVGDGDIAAEDGRPLKVYGPGSICTAAQTPGTPALAAGVPVKSNASGLIVLAAATDKAVGWVHESNTAQTVADNVGAKLRVFVWPHISTSAGAQGATGTQGFQGAQGAQGYQGAN